MDFQPIKMLDLKTTKAYPKILYHISLIFIKLSFIKLFMLKESLTD